MHIYYYFCCLLLDHRCHVIKILKSDNSSLIVSGGVMMPTLICWNSHIYLQIGKGVGGGEEVIRAEGEGRWTGRRWSKERRKGWLRTAVATIESLQVQILVW